MNSQYRNETFSSSTVADDERRCNDRNKFLTRVHVRKLDAPHSERMATTQDISRDGIYFVVRASDYAVDMRLMVTLPDAKVKWTCRVVRIDALPNGGQGVAVVRIADLAS